MKYLFNVLRKLILRKEPTFLDQDVHKAPFLCSSARVKCWSSLASTFWECNTVDYVCRCTQASVCCAAHSVLLFREVSEPARNTASHFPVTNLKPIGFGIKISLCDCLIDDCLFLSNI